MPLPLPIDAAEVRRLRFVARMSVPELATAAGMSSATIYRIEDGDTRTPYAPTVERLAATFTRLLGIPVPVEDLLLHDEAVA